MDTEEREPPPLQPGTPVAGERRTRRSVGISTAFRAIKAQHSANRTRMEVLADRMIAVASSTKFLLLHVVVFVLWIAVNTPLPGMPQFDPYPFGLLTTTVSLEAIFLSIFVLMTQHRESRIAELREELTLQVNLRVEEEITKTLHLVAGLYSRLNLQLADDPELRAMLEPLDPKAIESDLADQINTAMPHFHLKKRQRKEARAAAKAARAME
jgi:uncharacterized membrane protein